MHREYRPEDLHHLDAGATVPAGGGDVDDSERALVAFTALLGGLIGGDVVLGFFGWDRGWLPFGLSLSLIAAVVGRDLHRLRRAALALEGPDRGRPGAGAGVRWRPSCSGSRSWRPRWSSSRCWARCSRRGHFRARAARSGGWSSKRRGPPGCAATARRSRSPAHEVVVGDRVIVRPGERVPVDGTIVTGRSTVDQSALTGESLPIDKGPGDPVYTGTINQFGVIEVDAEKVGAETTFGQVLALVAQARRKKARVEKTADRLARYFLPVVEIAAGGDPARWAISRAGPTSGRGRWPCWWSRARAGWCWRRRRRCSPAWPGWRGTAS